VLITTLKRMATSCYVTPLPDADSFIGAAMQAS
jgi:hypothetical protein